VSTLVRIYKRNIYGVMGTLVFHILLISAFLLADVDMKGNVREEHIIIEFPDILPSPDEMPAEKQGAPESSENNIYTSPTTNTASNRLSREKTTTSADDFFDETFRKEMEAAQNLASNVREQLSKEVTNIEDIKMPIESTRGMDPDSIENVIYVGESNIVYYLEDRYHIDMPIPVYLAQSGGVIIVDISVNQKGKVVKAESRRNRKVKNEQTYLYAQSAALNTTFNSTSDAPEIQKGTIHYTFISQ